MKLTENHAYEQFFFSEETTDRLVSLALPFKKPLLLCTPSLAVALAEKKRKFILLDRDRRFKKLRGYEQFDLRNPHMVFAKFDAIFADPPFSNISLEDFHRTVELLAQGAPKRPPLYLCYINTREAELLRLFADFNLVRYPRPLGYRSVKGATQDRIYLYGPPTGLR